MGDIDANKLMGDSLLCMNVVYMLC